MTEERVEGRGEGGQQGLKILPQRRAEKSVEFYEAVHNPVIRQGDLILLEDTHLLRRLWGEEEQEEEVEEKDEEEE